MKIPLFLRLGLWLLCACIFAGCKNNDSSSGTPQDLVSVENTTQAQEDSPVIEDAATDEVHVCQSAGATKYHIDAGCHCLKRCKHEIATMTKKQAENMGLGLCGYED